MTDKISYSDFSKLDLRVGKILSAEDHPDADKLLVLKVDLNEKEPRTIVAGLKGHYEKPKLTNKKAIFVANLAPIKLRGIESNGMILAAESNNKKITLLMPDQETETGSKIK